MSGPVCSLLLRTGVVLGAAEKVAAWPLPPLVAPPLPRERNLEVPPKLMVEVFRPRVDTNVFVSGLETEVV